MLSLDALDFQSPQTHLSFADALADEGDFFRAITEYKRVMHYFPKYEKREWVSFQIGRMYFLGGRYEQSKKYLVPLTITTDKRLLFYTNNFLALAYFENQEFINAHRLFSRLKKKNSAIVSRYDYIVYEGLSNAGMYRFKEARFLYEKESKALEEEDKKTYGAFFKNANKILSDVSELSAKSPGWAIFWGSIFPGGGHLYLKQWSNALASFLLVTGAGILAVDGIINDKLVQWGIFTPLTTGFFIGSIYSAYRQARKYNLTFRQSSVKELTREVKLLNLRIDKQFSF